MGLWLYLVRKMNSSVMKMLRRMMKRKMSLTWPASGWGGRKVGWASLPCSSVTTTPGESRPRPPRPAQPEVRNRF